MIKLIFRMAILLVFVASCKKEKKVAEPEPVVDTTSPVISLKGPASDTIALNSTYTDPGVTATDNMDGDISSKVKVVGTVDEDREGGNYIYYSVQDAAGNSTQKSRYVYVRNEAHKYEGTYKVVSDCGPGFNGINSTAQIVASNEVNNKITISTQQFQSPGFGVGVNISGNSMTMYTQPVGTSLASGTGTISADGKSFTITTTYSPAIQGSSGCTIVYTKQ